MEKKSGLAGIAADSPAMDDEIPPLTHPDNLPPVRSQDDLRRLWRMLMGPLGFGGRSLWLLVLDADDRPTPLILQIEDLPRRPDPGQLSGVVRVCQDVLREQVIGGSVVFLLTRPGQRGVTPDEAVWARDLHQAVRKAGLPVWPLHRANDDELCAFAPDDLAASA